MVVSHCRKQASFGLLTSEGDHTIADTNHPIAALHWFAIDVARYWNAVIVETASGQRHRFRMTNSAEDMLRLTEFLLGLGGRCRVALESTGDYHRPIAHRFSARCVSGGLPFKPTLRTGNPHHLKSSASTHAATSVLLTVLNV